MQRLVYTVDIEDGISLDDTFLETLDQVVEDITGCKVMRSKVMDDDAIVENGEWEEEEDE